MTKTTEDKRKELTILNVLSNISKATSLKFVKMEGLKHHWLSKKYHDKKNQR